MPVLNSWKDIVELESVNFLIINVTNREDKKFSQKTYDKNLGFINGKKQSGDWEIGKNTDYEYVVLFFHDHRSNRIFIGKKEREATHLGGTRYLVNIDHWREIGNTENSIVKFSEGLPISSQPVLIWRRDAESAPHLKEHEPIKKKLDDSHLRKYCRICWNTKNWQEPTGEAKELESPGSYVQKNGFGHEEWLFDWSKTLKGYLNVPIPYKYGFLQPIGKFRQKYVNKTMDILLYTVNPDGHRFIVAKIKNVYIPDDVEARWVFEQYRKQNCEVP